MIDFLKVHSEQQIARVVRMAEIVWPHHYNAIVGNPQITYMLKKFQSVSAIKSQLAEGYCYFILSYNKDDVGYFSTIDKTEELFISKLYVMPNFQGRGFGSSALDYIKKTTDANRIRLTVNKMNTSSIEFYRKNKFTEIDKVVMDIGGGYVMDDYVMEYTRPEDSI